MAGRCGSLCRGDRQTQTWEPNGGGSEVAQGLKAAGDCSVSGKGVTGGQERTGVSGSKPGPGTSPVLGSGEEPSLAGAKGAGGQQP